MRDVGAGFGVLLARARAPQSVVLAMLTVLASSSAPAVASEPLSARGTGTAPVAGSSKSGKGTQSKQVSARAVTLEEAVGLAIRRSPEIDGAQRRVLARRTATLAPWAAFMPRLRLESGIDYRQDPLAGPFYSYFQPDASVQSQAFSGGLSLTGMLPVGTEWELGVGQRVAYYSSLVEALNPSLEPTLRARISQPLWRGMLPSVGLSPVAQAEARVDVEQAIALATADRVALTVALSWVEASRAFTIVSMRERSLRLASDFEEVTKKLIVGGELSQLDMALAQQTVAQREVELVQARNEAVAAQDGLAGALYAAPGETVVVATLEGLDPPQLDAGTILPLALKHAPALLRMKAQAAELEARAVAEGDDAWPDIRVGVNGELRGLSGQSTCVGGYLADGISACGVHPIYRGGYDQALLNMATARFYQVGVTLSGEIPVWPAPASADARSTKEEIVAIRAEERAEELRLAHAVYRAVRDTQRDKQTLTSSEVAVQLSREALSAQETKLRAGRSTTFDLVRAQELLILAELQAIEARARLARSKVALDSLVGALLPDESASSPEGTPPAAN